MAGDVRQTQAWKDLVRWAKTWLPWTCHLCRLPIPVSVPRDHPLSYHLDHLEPVSKRPDLALVHHNVAPSHKQCNSWRRDRPLTPGLLLEAASRFGEREPAALNFFTQRDRGRGKSSQPPGGRPTVPLDLAPPVSRSVTSAAADMLPKATDEGVTEEPGGPLS